MESTYTTVRLGSDSWIEDARCKGMDLSVFFIDYDVIDRRDVMKQAEIAKEYCYSCPVQQQCLDYAIVNKVKYGIWGGMNEKHRRKHLNSNKNYYESLCK